MTGSGASQRNRKECLAHVIARVVLKMSSKIGSTYRQGKGDKVLVQLPQWSVKALQRNADSSRFLVAAYLWVDGWKGLREATGVSGRCLTDSKSLSECFAPPVRKLKSLRSTAYQIRPRSSYRRGTRPASSSTIPRTINKIADAPLLPVRNNIHAAAKLAVAAIASNTTRLAIRRSYCIDARVATLAVEDVARCEGDCVRIRARERDEGRCGGCARRYAPFSIAMDGDSKPAGRAGKNAEGMAKWSQRTLIEWEEAG